MSFVVAVEGRVLRMMHASVLALLGSYGWLLHDTLIGRTNAAS